ncbi:hypothetical protein GCM10025865_03800 [Paraoerskovia sediminicola]|uniref:DUF308 domain-containing protein n=1 Tax=Paraoerskovia sediminicola TaxID=1138587 RepID=A0ABN6X8M2_9CELL|nr:DUF308 domain-containing protein [Paraoerskovia sediminicola]BDZ41081.1 hypothetical protein GCM10025865_03800 [Paraoerskovia sediminicola]
MTRAPREGAGDTEEQTVRVLDRARRWVEPARRRVEPAMPYVNATTLRGALFVGLGLLVILLPNISVGIIEAAIAVGLAVSGAMDLRATFRRRLRFRTRIAYFFRGLGSWLATLLFVVSASSAFTLLIIVLAVYLTFRGVITVVIGFVSRDRRRRWPRVTGGAVQAALGALLVVDPDIVSDGVIVSAAIASVLAGSIIIAYGMRHDRSGDVSAQDETPTLTEILWLWVHEVDIGPERREDLAETLYLDGEGAAASSWRGGPCCS